MVKLGGSAITDKEVRCRAKPQNIARLCGELAPHAAKLLIVHGAGSFGHIGASKFHLKGGLSNKRSLLGAAEVQREVRELHNLVLGGLHKAGVPAVSFPPLTFLKFSGGCLSDYDFKQLRGAMARGFVPVTFGDVVLDDRQGVAICSGDDLVRLLCSEFKAEGAVFVTDVDGIYDSNPKGPGKAKLLREIDPLRPQAISASGGKAHDVTGAMAGKLEVALDVAALGADVYVVNGTAKGRLAALLGGRKGVWTRMGGVR